MRVAIDAIDPGKQFVADGSAAHDGPRDIGHEEGIRNHAIWKVRAFVFEPKQPEPK